MHRTRRTDLIQTERSECRGGKFLTRSHGPAQTITPPGSPVQFVCVELLKGDVSGEHAVCLTFKNISKVTLTALEIHFKCKGVDGVILCEDRFEYRDLEVKPGELFGMDDAVFVTAKAITSVDVSLCNVYNGKRVVHLDGIKRVRLPAPKRLSAELEKALETRMNRPELKYQPQVFENGWYCACGAFHPKEEDTVYCSECGCDRILLQNALNTLLQPEQPAQTEPELETPLAPQAEEPTRIIGRSARAGGADPDHGVHRAVKQNHSRKNLLQSRPVCWMPECGHSSRAGHLMQLRTKAPV